MNRKGFLERLLRHNEEPAGAGQPFPLPQAVLNVSKEEHHNRVYLARGNVPQLTARPKDFLQVLGRDRRRVYEGRMFHA